MVGNLKVGFLPKYHKSPKFCLLLSPYNSNQEVFPLRNLSKRYRCNGKKCGPDQTATSELFPKGCLSKNIYHQLMQPKPLTVLTLSCTFLLVQPFRSCLLAGILSWVLRISLILPEVKKIQITRTPPYS